MPNTDSKPLRVAQFGLGPIGQASVALLSSKPWAQVVGAVDNDPNKAGQDLGQLTGETRLANRPVTANFEQLLQEVETLDAVIHTAGSRAATAIDQIEPMARHGLYITSSCEELLFPWLRAPEAADRLDRLCRQEGARVVGTGVNPGFVMDLMPVAATAVSQRVDAIQANRVVDATDRRGPLQKKIGSGLAPATFQARFEQGQAGHAGFQESAALIAHSLGWPWDDLTETLEPVIAERRIETPYVTVEPGQTRGLHQRCIAKVGGATRIDLDLVMALDEPEPHDVIKVLGEPPLDLRFESGVPGDPATVAAMVNAVRRLPACKPGLLLPTDLPAPKHG
jgi:4-hydroxy-tetrahydrodipicolinate reductase